MQVIINYEMSRCSLVAASDAHYSFCPRMQLWEGLGTFVGVILSTGLVIVTALCDLLLSLRFPQLAVLVEGTFFLFWLQKSRYLAGLVAKCPSAAWLSLPCAVQDKEQALGWGGPQWPGVYQCCLPALRDIAPGKKWGGLGRLGRWLVILSHFAAE